MDFEWDLKKARINTKKHRVTFGEGAEVFGDIHSSVVADPDHSKEELRFIIFGQSTHQRHLVVSFTDRDDRIRIISARQMTRRERKAYER